MSKGFVAFLGANNSGKSSLMKFFYEFRSIFEFLSSVNNWQNIFQAKKQEILFAPEILDIQELFCNVNIRPLKIELRFTLGESSFKDNNLAFIQKIIITISREKFFEFEIYLNENTKLEQNNLQINQNEMILTQRFENICDISYNLEVFKDLSKTIYIGPFRNAISLLPVLDPNYMNQIDKSYLRYFDISTGRAFIQQWKRYKTGYNIKDNKTAVEITEDIKHIFEFDSLDINSSDDDQTLRIYINKNPYTLSGIGSGMIQFFLVLANLLGKNPSYILIDEPEQNLHPRLQLDFLTTLGKYASKGVLFATHSFGLARASAERIYMVQKSNNGSEVTEYEKNPRLSELLGELSFSAYKEFGFNKILLVEGPTEVTTIQQFLRKYGKDHEILLLPLGGSSLINDSFESEFQEIKRISDNINVLIDSELTSSNAKLNPQRQAFKEMCIRNGICCHILNRRATENYFSDRAVKLVKGSKFRGLEPYDKLADVPGWSKAENWKIAKEMDRSELEGTDLGDFIKKLCKE